MLDSNSYQRVIELLKGLKEEKITVSSREDQLIVNDPEKRLTGQWVKLLKENKPLILGFLEETLGNAYKGIAVIQRQAYYDVSHAQRRLWIVDQITKGEAAYNMHRAYRFKGHLHVAALQQSFRSLLERHESLRTTIHLVDGEPKQKVHDLGDLVYAFETEDLRAADDREARAFSTAREHAYTRFDLQRDAPIRIKLITLGEADYLFLITMHHIASDGWSMQVLTKEILTLYGAFSQGLPDPLAPLPIQYKDYTYWQNKMLAEPNATSLRHYWLKQFEGNIPVLDLTLDFPRQTKRSYQGNKVFARLDRDTFRKVKALEQRFDATLYMILLAAVKTLLHRYTGQEDIVIGSPIAGRDHGSLENQIGFYVNTLPMRTRFSGDASFAALLSKVKQTALDAFDHQAYPYDCLVECLNLTTEVNRNPLFDINFVLQNTDVVGLGQIDEARDLRGIEVEPYDAAFRSSKFDIKFDVKEIDDTLEVVLEFNTDLFTEHRIRRMLAHYCRLLGSIARDPGLPLRDLEYLSEAETIELNGFSGGLEQPAAFTSLVSRFEASAEKTPEACALVQEGRTMTYRELDREANRVANFLRAHAATGTLVGLLANNSFDAVVAILGVLKSGNSFLPIDGNLPPNRVKHIVEDAALRVVIFQKRFYGTVSKLQWECASLRHIVCTDSENIGEEEEGTNEMNNESLWDYVADQSYDDISLGGWVSSFTGKALSREEMDEYGLNCLTKLKPYLTKDTAVMEIGCSSGITLMKVAPFVRHYCGIDLSSRIIEKTKTILEEKGVNNARLVHLAAHQLAQLGAGKFNVFILNSVVQSFNGYNYFRKVLSQIIEAAEGRAVIFFGDIQDQDKKEELVAATQTYYRSNGKEPSRVKTDWSNELFLSRTFFDDLRHEFPQIVSVDVSAKIHHLKNELTEFRYDVVVHIDRDQPAAAPAAAPRTKFSWDKRELNRYPVSRPEVPVAGNDLAYVIYTSGSTGMPKGVAVRHDSISNYIRWADQYYFRDARQGNFPLFTPLSFDLTLTSVFCPLVRGKKLFILPGNNPGTLLQECFHNLEIDTIKLTPTHVLLLNYTPVLYTEAANIIIGGETLKKHHLETLWSMNPDLTVFNEYGPTEATVGCSVEQVKKGDPRITIGVPAANASMQILDRRGERLPVGNSGELFIGGVGVAAGYLNNVELTAEHFINDPGRPGAAMFRTGDFGKWLEDGRIDLGERRDDQVKIRGFRVELKEIEAVILQFGKVSQNVVAHRRLEDGSDALIAYLVHGEEFAYGDLQVFLKERLPEYMVPSQYVRLDRIPYTPNGKLDHRALPGPAALEAEERAITLPGSALEKKLAQIWQEVLGRNDIGMHDNFFDLGGHSLKATQMLSRIFKELQVNLTLAEVFDNTTIGQLAAIIDNKEKEDYTVIEVAPAQADYPLSSAQKRMWIAQRLARNKSAYNTYFGYCLTGDVNEKAINYSFAKLVQRHEILRTVFVETAEAPRQVVLPYDSPLFRVRHVDLSTAEAAGEQARQLYLREINTPFSLDEAPLVRVTLVKLSARRYWLFAVMHHIISDGGSMRVFINDIISIYNAYLRGITNPLAPLAVQYKDFAHWENRFFAGERMNAHRAYWLQQFSGTLPVLQLPADLQGQHQAQGEGGILEFGLDAAECGHLKEMTRLNQGTLYMTLVAAVKALLYTYSGQSDIIIGSPIAGRYHKDLENQIGFYLNTLPLRTRFAEDDSFRALLRKVKHTVLSAFEHQRYPFDELVSQLKIARDADRTPLFNVWLVLQNSVLDGPEAGDMLGVEAEPITTQSVISRYDLRFSFKEYEKGIHGKLEYSTALFRPATVGAMIDTFRKLIRSFGEQDGVLLKAWRLKQDHSLLAPAAAGGKEAKITKRDRSALHPPGSRPVVEECFITREKLPLVIKANADLDLAQWVAGNQAKIADDLLRYGGILFRGFRVKDAGDFERAVQATGQELLKYDFGSTPRSVVANNVYTSTEYPADQEILMHNEMSYTKKWPRKLWFYCAQPALEGGETPLVDSRLVYRLIAADVRASFEKHKLLYIRNYHPNLDVPWQKVFQTDRKEAVADFCKLNEIDYQWVSNEQLQTREVCDAVIRHPVTGESVWFNQAHIFHVSSLQEQVREMLLSILNVKDLPRNVYLGNASAISNDVFEQIKAIYKQSSVTFPWQKDDVLLLDNILTGHGRSAFKGPRKVVVAMTN